ncbi:hypothetical protein [Polaromonas sp.]|uniref:hypothetical protein n=1 Tax=Polaromonas sp. TaxID=1869339 RepID=UPI0035664102
MSWRNVHVANYALSTLNVNIRSPQRICLNKLPARLHIVTHQRKHVIGFNGVVDLIAQQAVHGGGFGLVINKHTAPKRVPSCCRL